MNVRDLYRSVFCQGFHNVLLVIGAIFLGYSLYAAIYFFSFEIIGTVVSEKTECKEPLRNRCDRFLFIKKEDGAVFKYLPVAGFFDYSQLSPGKKIEKNKLSYEYQVNEKSYYFKHYKLFLLLAVVGLVLIRLWVSLPVRVFMNSILRKKL
jgi:hypothetical protein